MSRHFGWIIAGLLLIGMGTPANAQVNVQFGRGTPTVTLGQPAYGQQPMYGQYTTPYTQQGFTQPYTTQPGYTQPGYNQQGYVQGYQPPRQVQPGYTTQPYTTQATRSTQYYSGYSTPVYAPGYGTQPYTPYGQQPTYPGHAPVAQPWTGTQPGVIINGRTYTIPR